MSVCHSKHSVRRRGARAALAAAGAVAIAITVTAHPARAQSMDSGARPFDIRPFVGAYIPTGGQRDQLINAVMTGGQAQWSISPRWSLVGTYAWSPSADKSTLDPANKLYTGDEQRLDVRQYDVGVQARLGDLGSPSASDSWSMHPFVGAGLGSRQYKYRHPAIAETLVGKSGATDMMGYGGLGTDVVRNDSRVGFRFELRDYMSQYKGLYDQLATSQTRNDVTFSAGLNFGF
ncbi:MAG: hypothetical protein ACYCVL_06320 [Gemmatimonadaceae bacterium]